MATYTARPAESSYPVKTRPVSGIVIQPFTYAVATALAENDVVELCKVPVNALITDFYLNVPDLDTHATPTIELDVGLTKATSGEDNVDVDGFVDGSSVGQSAGIIDLQDKNGTLAFPYLCTGDVAPYDGVHSKFSITVSAAVATGATSVTIRGWLQYVMDADWESSTDPS
jgi:hypothetical protein